MLYQKYLFLSRYISTNSRMLNAKLVKLSTESLCFFSTTLILSQSEGTVGISGVLAETKKGH
jgi:hypothetical protein